MQHYILCHGDRRRLWRQAGLPLTPPPCRQPPLLWGTGLAGHILHRITHTEAYLRRDPGSWRWLVVIPLGIFFTIAECGGIAEGFAGVRYSWPFVRSSHNLKPRLLLQECLGISRFVTLVSLDRIDMFAGTNWRLLPGETHQESSPSGMSPYSYNSFAGTASNIYVLGKTWG